MTEHPVLSRLEPGPDPINDSSALVSIAISLKRIADALSEPNAYGEIGSQALSNSILRGLSRQS